MTEADLLRIVEREHGWDNPRRRSALAGLRYRRDPKMRLEAINRERAKRGLPPRRSLDDAHTRLPA